MLAINIKACGHRVKMYQSHFFSEQKPHDELQPSIILDHYHTIYHRQYLAPHGVYLKMCWSKWPARRKAWLEIVHFFRVCNWLWSIYTHKAAVQVEFQLPLRIFWFSHRCYIRVNVETQPFFPDAPIHVGLDGQLRPMELQIPSGALTPRPPPGPFRSGWGSLPHSQEDPTPPSQDIDCPLPGL